MAFRRTPHDSPAPARVDRSLPDGPLPPDHALETALVGLVSDGTLTDDQARAVRAARAGAAEAEARSQGTPAVRRSPVPEILGYAGAALLGSASLSLVLNSWDRWPEGLRLGLLAAAVVVLWAAGLTAMALGGGRRAVAGQDNRRRLVATLLALSVPLAGLATLQALDLAMTLPDRSPWYLLPGVVALAVAVGAAALVRGAMTTLAVAAGAFWTAAATAMVLFADVTETWVAPVAAWVLGIVWLYAAPRLLAVPRLGEALGMAWLLVGLVPAAMRPVDEFARGELPAEVMTAAWVSRSLLLVMAVGCLLMFARGAHWPYAAGGVAAGVFAALSIGGGTLGWIAGMFVAGAVLLALSAVLVVIRRRREAAATSAPGP